MVPSKRPITSIGTPARPCLSILSSAKLLMYTVSALSCCGASPGGAADAPDATAALAQRTAALLDHPAYALDAFAAPSTAPEYGSAASSDGGHEVRFAVGITRIPRLQGLYSVDIRRLKGNAWSYKFVYDTLLQRLDLGSHV